MKRVFIIALVVMCSQGFCMDQGAAPRNEGNTVGIDREKVAVLANQVLEYFTHNDQDEPVADPRQALAGVMPEIRAAIEFDLEHVGGRGWGHYRNSANLERLLVGVLGVAFGNVSLIDEGETVANAIRSSQELEQHIESVSASIAGMSVGEQRNAYLFFYSNMCNTFKVLNRLAENMPDGEVDDIQGRAVHRTSVMLRQMSDMVIRIGRYVLDPVQQ